MKIKTLKTRNFKRLGSREFTFTDGINFILGDNGKGKSTLTRAIATALYGVGALPGLSEDVASWGTNSWTLELEFSHEGEDYLVRRTKSSAKLTCEEETVAEGNLPVTEAIESLLGINIRDYYLLVHSRQGETSYILSYGATALQRKVEEFSGVEAIEALQKKSRDTGRQLQSEADSIEVREVEGLDDAQKELKALQAELQGMQELEAPVRPSVVSRKYADWLKRQDILQRIERLEKEEIAEVKEPTPVDEAKERIKELEEEKANTWEYLQHKKYLKDKLLNLKAPEPRVGKPTEPEEPYAVDRLEKLNLRASELKKQIKDGVCSSCGTVLDENKEKSEEELSRILIEIPELQEEVEEYKELSRQYKTLLRAYERYCDDLERHTREKAELANELSEYSDNPVWDKDEELDSLQRSVIDYREQYSRYIGYVDAVKARDERMQELQESLEELPSEEVTEDDVKKAEEDWESYQESRTKLEVMKTKVESLERDVIRLKKAEEEEKKKAEQKNNLEIKADKCDRLSKYLAERRQSYLLQVWDSILGSASTLLSHTTGGWLTGVNIKEGKFLFEEKGAWVPAVEASGAQSAFIGSALRIAMNSVLYRGDGFMVFDEPTADMTEDNSRSLVAGLAEAADQLFVVTHRSSDQGLAGNIVEIT